MIGQGSSKSRATNLGVAARNTVVAQTGLEGSLSPIVNAH